MSTDLVQRRAFDLTRAPTEQWNEEMMQLVAATVLKRASTRGEQVYCLAVAEALDLNPFIDEVYFLPTKSKDGSGPGIKPYIGRNGLVKKARERDAYYESETVHANDKFRMVRKRTGEVEVTHSYGATERGEIVGAYAFLHFRNGDRPAFAWALLSEYLPEFDEEWKLAKSPWGNQTSSMIEKCAMIKAGRKRLDLGSVLVDGEIDRVAQMDAIGPGTATAPAAGDFDWESLEADAGVVARLRAAVVEINELVPLAWTPARLEMVLSGMSSAELDATAEKIEADIVRARESASAEPAAPDEQTPAEVGERPAAPGSGSEGPENVEVVDAEVYCGARSPADEPCELRAGHEGHHLAGGATFDSFLPKVDADHVAALRSRKVALEDELNEPTLEEDRSAMLVEELERVELELAAAEDPGQTSLGL